MRPYQSFFRASCSWWSEDLFGQSSSVVLSIQALGGLPCLGSFSIVRHFRHKEGPPWLGSYFVVHCVWCFMGQLLDCSAANAGLWGERGYSDGSAPYTLLSGIPLPPWLPGSPPQAFTSTVSSLTSLQSVCNQQQPARPGIVPQSLNSSSQLLCLPWDLHSCPECVWLQQGLSESYSI